MSCSLSNVVFLAKHRAIAFTIMIFRFCISITIQPFWSIYNHGHKTYNHLLNKLKESRKRTNRWKLYNFLWSNPCNTEKTSTLTYNNTLTRRGEAQICIIYTQQWTPPCLGWLQQTTSCPANNHQVGSSLYFSARKIISSPPPHLFIFTDQQEHNREDALTSQTV